MRHRHATPYTRVASALLAPVLLAALAALGCGRQATTSGANAADTQTDLSKMTREERNIATSKVQVGEPAPDFQVTDSAGAPFSLADQRGKVVLINFFATYCAPCLKELPHMQELWQRRQEDAGFTMLIVGREETTETVNAFRESKGFTFPMASDPDRAVYDLFAVQGIPRTLLISTDGHVLYSALGFRESELAEIEQLIDQQLATTGNRETHSDESLAGL